MALHQVIQWLLHRSRAHGIAAAAAYPQAPPALLPLIDAIESRTDASMSVRSSTATATERLLAIYLLKCDCLLFAVMPLALGWTAPTMRCNPFAGCGRREVMVIGTVSAIYWQGHRHDWQAQWLSARTPPS